MPRPSPKQPMTPADLVLERRKLDRQRNLSSEPKVRPEVVEKLVELSRKRRESEPPKASLKERSALVTQRMIESGNRYAGNPELLLKEHPRRNFENPPKQE